MKLRALALLVASFAAPDLRAEDVDFSREIVPILKKNCARCHSGKRKKGGFSLETRASLLEGGDSGEAVVPGDANASLLIRLVSGKDPERVMPESGRKLSAREISRLRSWIDSGVSWPEGQSLTTAVREDLALRPPKIPVGTDHPLDYLLARYFEREKIDPTDRIGAAVFARRLYLDVLGVLPTSRELDEPVGADRIALIDRLLADRARYAAHWLTFWNDLLRNDYRGTGYIDGGRKQISSWLYDALYDNTPFDEFVRQLILPVPGAEGFTKGIVWRGVVNASQRPEMQAAQNVSQVFLGINIKCASCHDSFINEWKLADAYGLANVFSGKPLEMHRCNKPTGEKADTKFLYPQLGEIDASASLADRRAQLAKILTTEENGRFSRTIVNRLWARFMGHGIVEPVDDMDAQPWSEDLLDWLAADLVKNGYDLKRTMRIILSSRAYQAEAIDDSREDDGRFVFRGPLLKRMTAEQFVDAVSRLTGNPQATKAAFTPSRTVSERQIGDGEHSFVKFRSGVLKEGKVDIDVSIDGARSLWLVVDDAGDNGNHDWADWGEPRLEGPRGVLKLTEHQWRSATTGHGKVRKGKNAVNKSMSIAGKTPAFGLGTHAHSVIVWNVPEGYDRFKAYAGPDDEAVAASPSGHTMRFTVMTDMQVRSAFSTANALTRALGRPNREQVVTERDSAATTLQALELTNGATLDKLLSGGAKSWLERGLKPTELVREVYSSALGRSPTTNEVGIAAEVIGEKPGQDSLLDFLWIVAMLPEFQLIY